MKRGWILAGIAGLAFGSSLVAAQDAPENLLPPGFDRPRPTATATPRPAAPTPPPSGAGSPEVLSPSELAPTAPSGSAAAQPKPVDLAKLPSLRELEAMSTEELDELFGLRPKFDIPAAARRAVAEVGVIAPAEGGLPTGSLKAQPARLVRASLQGTKGPLVSRWGHILLRRALASRLDAPDGMDPAEFAALRAGVLNRIGESGVARALVQDVDTGNYSPALTNAAIDAYVASGDVTGACPAILLGRASREDPEWKMLAGVCNAYDGEETRAQNDLRKLQVRGEGERIDVLLAQRLAGAAGSGRKSVTIEWNNIETMTPYRFAMVNAVGETIPDAIAADLDPIYLKRWATAPMATLGQRLRGSDLAGQSGILSSAAMVDLYGQIYAAQGDGDENAMGAAQQLREAYVASEPASRLAAIRSLWGSDDDTRYGRMVLTAFAAARMTPSDDFAEDAGPLIASMLAAGLDRDAARWADVVDQGTLGWALLALARPQDAAVSSGDFDSFRDDDASASQRKSAMLLAGLAGLGRLESGDVAGIAEDMGIDLDRPTRWSRAIDRAAAVENKALVAFLAGVGMQGDSWDRMTARHLYHIVAALNRVGLSAEARMIAAEAVARS